MEHCEVCGFTWDAIDPAELPGRLSSGVAAMAALVRAEPGASSRPAEDRWSTLEYAAHLRDVLLNVRDRIILGAIEDNPEPKKLYPDARVGLGLYRQDTPALVAADLETAGGLFLRTLNALSREQMGRPIFYAWPTPATRTLDWVAAQVLHEVEHHLDDVRTNGTLV